MKVIIALTLLCSISKGILADDDYVTTVKGYIDAGTCDSVYTGTLCGTNATSYYSTFEYNGYRVVIANGIPDHEAETDALVSNPNTRCERWTYMVVPLSPTQGTNATSTSMGVTALAVTGGTFFNHLSSTDGDVALYNEGTTLDSCNGHSNAVDQYHYHANIACVDSYTNATECEHIGYARDGVPIYGYCNDASGTQYTSCYSISSGYSESELTISSGTYYSASMEDYYEYDSDAYSAGTCNLDKANGATHPTTGEYSYFMVSTYPWVPMYYYGDEGASSLCSAA